MRRSLPFLVFLGLCWGCSKSNNPTLACPSYQYYQAEPKPGQGRYSKTYRRSLRAKQSRSYASKSFITSQNYYKKRKYKIKTTLRGY